MFYVFVLSVSGNVEGELMNAETSLDAALFTTREMRQDWINRINQYFDGLETKITEFANGKLASCNFTTNN